MLKVLKYYEVWKFEKAKTNKKKRRKKNSLHKKKKRKGNTE